MLYAAMETTSADVESSTAAGAGEKRWSSSFSMLELRTMDMKRWSRTCQRRALPAACVAATVLVLAVVAVISTASSWGDSPYNMAVSGSWFFQGSNAAMILGQLGTIELLNGSNYSRWRERIDMVLALSELDFALQNEKPTEPDENVPQYEHKLLQYSIDKVKWEKSNRKCLMIIRNLIVDSIRGSISECETAKEYLHKVAIQFTGSSKAYASTLISNFINMRDDGSGVRSFIQKMTSTVAKLNKYLGQPLPKEFVVHIIMKSLPKEYETFHVHYNTTVQDKWNIDQLMAQCVQEEERLKSCTSDSLNFAQHQAKKRNNYSKPVFKKQGQAGRSSQGASSSNSHPKSFDNKGEKKKFSVDIDTCLHCKKKGHYKKNCPDFLKYLLQNGIPYEEDATKRSKNR